MFWSIVMILLLSLTVWWTALHLKCWLSWSACRLLSMQHPMSLPLLLRNRRRKSPKCNNFTIFFSFLFVCYNNLQGKKQQQNSAGMDLILSCIFELSRAAIGEQKRLKSKKVLSDKKAFRRGRDGWDWNYVLLSGRLFCSMRALLSVYIVG